MAITHIPDEDKAVISSLSKFSKNTLDSILKVFDGDIIEDLEIYRGKRLPQDLELHGSNSKELLKVLITLSFSYKNSKVLMSTFVDDVVNLVSSNLETFEKEILKINLNYILDAENSLGVVISSFDLYSRQEKIASEFKILTDIRHYFTKSDEPVPQYGIIFHNLEVSYYENGEIKRHYVSLGSSDLKQLKFEIERAILKEKSLKNAELQSLNLYSMGG